MTERLLDKTVIAGLAYRGAGLDKPGGNPRLKRIVGRLLTDLFTAIDDLDMTMDEFWAGVEYIRKSAATNELGLLVPAVAAEHLLDLRLDEEEKRAGITGGTARTIEGPLYVAGAPREKYEARLDDGTDDAEVLFVEGQVRDVSGNPIPGALVEVWHANIQGFYSFFGPPQTPFNLRRTIETDNQGCYRFRSIMPSGYGCPPGGATDDLMSMLGRHGRRPAHVHFFVHAPGFRHLTTQFNIDGDKYLRDDFAFGTREELIPAVTRVTDSTELAKAGLSKGFAKIRFDIALTKDFADAPKTTVNREHARAA
jgi:catechol 1,2-dioxygenase